MTENLTKYQTFLAQVKNSSQYHDQPEFRVVVDEGEHILLSPQSSQGAILSVVKSIRVALEKIVTPSSKKRGTAMPPTVLPEPTDGIPEGGELMPRLQQSYDEMIETMKVFELTTSAVPSKEQVITKIRALSPELIAEIAKFKKPTLLINPAIPRVKKIEAINKHKLYPKQNDTYCEPGPDDALWGPEITKSTITIVDGALSMPVHPEVDQGLKIVDKAKKYQEIFTGKGMKMISADEYLMLQMMSLHYYKKRTDQGLSHEGSVKQMVENWADSDHQTVTLLNIDHLKDLSRVPRGYFHDVRVNLYWYNPGFVHDNYRSRPSVWISEF